MKNCRGYAVACHRFIRTSESVVILIAYFRHQQELNQTQFEHRIFTVIASL
jgi:hypothetical protein